jgi:hypothetical protein
MSRTKANDERRIREAYESQKIELDTSSITRTKAIDLDKYPVEQRVGLIQQYLSHGNIKRLARQNGIPQATLQYWKDNSEWWTDISKQLRKIKQEELDVKMTDVIHHTIEQLVDRVTKGEYYEDKKTGELKRLPMKGRELAVVTGVLFDKRALIRGDATSHSLRSTNPEELLKGLEDKFIAFSKKAQKEENDAKKAEEEKIKKAKEAAKIPELAAKRLLKPEGAVQK